MVNNFLSPPATQLIISLTKKAVTTLLPAVCAICDQSAANAASLCHTCQQLVEKQLLDRSSCCLACALPLNALNAYESGSMPPLYCPECQQQKPVFNRCVPAVPYNPLTAKLVNRLKHSGWLNVLQPITQQMIAAIASQYQRPVDLIVPVPLHPNRLARRGFNQSAEIARRLGAYLNIPVDIDACVRRRDDPSQQSLNRIHRQQNLANAFTFTRQLAGLRIAIADDVMTTGATGCALSQAALQAGAISVDIWCYARTPTPASSQ